MAAVKKKACPAAGSARDFRVIILCLTNLEFVLLQDLLQSMEKINFCLL